ncbi:hypothetical protein GQ44DRAFT_610098 [Phaeosphaeriaceae sp. PMI808]|nr:hypothetical protein GQ44DRAFT_610098 [Phaeosphaeriaceae sp. PMI808]
MLISTIYLVLLTALAAASPVMNATDDAMVHPYVCTDASFAGSCTNLHLETSKYVNVSTEYDDKISSAGPRKGPFANASRESDCHGKALPFTFPGVQKLQRYGFDGVVSSVRCDSITGWNGYR